MAENEQPSAPKPRKRNPAAVAAEHAPWLPTPWEPADALSLRRLAAGTANAVEQQRALAWILRCTGIHEDAYRPGSEDGRRETDYALGKASVGRQIQKLVKIDLARLKGEGSNEHA